jgi:DNA-binding NarL/FixJ family response regulator
MTRPSRKKPTKPQPLGNLPLSAATQRRVLAEFVRAVSPKSDAGEAANPPASSDDSMPTASKLIAARKIADALPPRLRQTLDLLLAGDAEKRIALKLGLKQSSVHSYVKVLYKRFNVSSRAELLAKFVSR